ncbi:MAG: Hsp20/alpha crystallin family protein [Acidobacteriota bacterium]
MLFYSRAVISPPVDIYETPDSVVVVVEISGATPESLKITKEGTTLIVSGDRYECCEKEKLHLYQMEIAYGQFERKVILPDGLGSEGVRADYESGFLRIELPKTGVSGKTSRIPIRSL